MTASSVPWPIWAVTFQTRPSAISSNDTAWVFATHNSKRIVGAVANLGFKVSDSTVDNIRQRKGLDPAPLRGQSTGLHQFLQAHWETWLAADFFTTEVLSWNGLVTYYTLFVIELRSRAVHVCGTTVSPNAEWMRQVARQLVDSVQGFALGKTHLIIDRDTKYVDGFRHTLEAAGLKIVLCPRAFLNATLLLKGGCVQ